MKTLDSIETKAPTFVIDGSKATTWHELVNSINSFVPASEWQGKSLDALDDILYGGYGTPDKFIIRWKSSEVSRKVFGYEATAAYFQHLANFRQLYEAGHIKTLFDTLIEIFRSHDNIELRLE